MDRAAVARVRAMQGLKAGLATLVCDGAGRTRPLAIGASQRDAVRICGEITGAAPELAAPVRLLVEIKVPRRHPFAQRRMPAGADLRALVRPPGMLSNNSGLLVGPPKVSDMPGDKYLRSKVSPPHADLIHLGRNGNGVALVVRRCDLFIIVRPPAPDMAPAGALAGVVAAGCDGDHLVTEASDLARYRQEAAGVTTAAPVIPPP